MPLNLKTGQPAPHNRVGGQSMAEYLWVSSALLLALVVPWVNGTSPADALIDAIVKRISRFVWWVAVL